MIISVIKISLDWLTPRLSGAKLELILHNGLLAWRQIINY